MTESVFLNAGSVLDQSATSEESGSRVVVFVAGERSGVDAAVRSVYQLYGDRRVLFVCEPRHRAWLPQGSSENILVVEQPFNPFGQRASRLLQTLRGRPIEACAIVVADLGFESLRFRLFALRLRPSSFLVLQAPASELPKPVGRISFGLLAGATLFLRIILKVPGIDAFQRNFRASCRPGGGILMLPKAVGWGGVALLARVLPPFDQPLAVGLAWLARIRLLLRSSRKGQAGDEIVHVIPSIGMGGVQRQLVLLLKNRSREFHHRVVVMRSEDRFFAPELNECGVEVHYLDSEGVRAGLRLSQGQQKQPVLQPLFTAVTSSLPLCCEIIKLNLFLRRLAPRPDVVHCWLLFANLAGSIAARLAKMPLVVTSVRNIQSEVKYNYYDPRWQRTLERATVPLANIITANAPAAAVDYRQFTGAPAEKIVTVPNGIDVKTLHRLTPAQRAEKRVTLGLDAKDVVVGTVARLAKEKDFETFLRAVALARRELPALRSVIIGGGPLRAHLESFAASLGLANFVQFLGERKDVGEVIQCYDAFLLTSVIEGMPNAVMESQLLGVPVVATRAGGTVDIIRDGETGLLAPIGDYQALASCIVRLFTEDGLWGRISLAAGRQISEGYTIQQLVARTETVYRKLLDLNAERITVPCAE
jgi:glycosyltransferase involved in cell wall biosynthesis